MSIWGALKRGLGTKDEPTRQDLPTFERLEPRLLLSADPTGLAAQNSLDSLDDQTDSVAAIVIDFEYTETAEGQGLANTEEDSQEEEDRIQTDESGQDESGISGLTASELTTLAAALDSTSQPLAPDDDSPNTEYRITNNDPVIDSHTEGSIETRGPPTEIVFIDSSLNLSFQLENALSSGVVVSVFDAATDGIQHITDVLSAWFKNSPFRVTV